MTLPNYKFYDKLNELFRFCPNGLCPFCGKDVLKGQTITPKIECPITKCLSCERSLID